MASGAETREKKDYIMEHILDGPDLHSPFGHIHLPHLELFGFDISITRHVFFMWLAALILIISFFVSTRRRGIVPSGFANAIAALVVDTTGLRRRRRRPWWALVVRCGCC